MKLGIVGAGSIVPFHIAAAMEVGFIPTVICGKYGSLNAQRISESYESLSYVESFSELMRTDLDAILIATSSSSLLPILLEAIKKNIPILVEKPVTTNVEAFKEIPPSAYDRIIVGYNRRHYPAVREFKDRMEMEKGGLIQILVPELATNPSANQDVRRSALLENATHIFDLVDFIFGPPLITDKKHLNDESGKKFIQANFCSGESRLGTIAISFGVPESPKISFWTGSKSFELSPIEQLRVSIGMERIEPSLREPMARYVKQYSNNLVAPENPTFKPGFLGQYVEFFTLAQGKKAVYKSATVISAQRAVSLAQTLLD